MGHSVSAAALLVAIIILVALRFAILIPCSRTFPASPSSTAPNLIFHLDVKDVPRAAVAILTSPFAFPMGGPIPLNPRIAPTSTSLLWGTYSVSLECLPPLPLTVAGRALRGQDVVPVTSDRPPLQPQFLPHAEVQLQWPPRSSSRARGMPGILCTAVPAHSLERSPQIPTQLALPHSLLRCCFLNETILLGPASPHSLLYFLSTATVITGETTRFMYVYVLPH